MNLLEEIVANKRGEMVGQRAARALEDVRDAAKAAPNPVCFSDALRAAPIGLIAEVKRRSPSAGAIREPFDPGAIAEGYKAGGAHAISCLMDQRYFGGGENDFRKVRAAMDLPMLYKEFVVDEWQVWHAREIGASAVLLIAAALTEHELSRLQSTVYDAGLEVLFEVHDAAEMDVACRLGCKIVGINNRNLKNFVTTLETTLELQSAAPEGALLISESGIRNAEDVARLKKAGIDGLLVGEHLLRKPDVAVAVQEMLAEV